MIGNAANVSRLAVIFAVGGSDACTRASAAFTSSSVRYMSTFQLKNKSISAVPRLVIEYKWSSPCTVFTASSSGLVTVTSIWSMGKTPLSTPTTMRGKLVSGKHRHRNRERQVDADRHQRQDDEDDRLSVPRGPVRRCPH